MLSRVKFPEINLTLPTFLKTFRSFPPSNNGPFFLNHSLFYFFYPIIYFVGILFSLLGCMLHTIVCRNC